MEDARPVGALVEYAPYVLLLNCGPFAAIGNRLAEAGAAFGRLCGMQLEGNVLAGHVAAARQVQAQADTRAGGRPQVAQLHAPLHKQKPLVELVVLAAALQAHLQRVAGVAQGQAAIGGQLAWQLELEAAASPGTRRQTDGLQQLLRLLQVHFVGRVVNVDGLPDCLAVIVHDLRQAGIHLLPANCAAAQQADTERCSSRDSHRYRSHVNTAKAFAN